MSYTLSSIIFPQNVCIHSVLVISIFIFEQKIFLYLLQVKYTLPVLSVNVFGKLFKNILISNGDYSVHFKSVSVRQKSGCIFMFTIIYCKINFWSYCHKYEFSCIMGSWCKFQRRARCDVGSIR